MSPELPSQRKSAMSSLSVEWTALQDAAAAVAAMANLAPERPSPEIRNFPAIIRDIGGVRLKLAQQAIADMGAMMRPGVQALLAVRARGQDATAPALTLWREFHHARAAVLAMVPAAGTMGHMRRA